MKRFLFTSILFTLSLLLSAQNSVKKLEQQKKQVEKDIAYTNSLIDKTKSEQKASLDNLNLIHVNINTRKKLIGGIDKQLSVLSVEIAERQKRVASLYDDLSVLKENYAKMVKFAYRNRSPYTQLMYVLASENINQAYRRMSYLKTYSDHRIKQAKRISQQSTEINRELAVLKGKKVEQEYLHNQKSNELIALGSEEKEYQTTLANLQAREKELKKDLEAKKKLAAQLDQQIENAIAEEARREAERRREAEKRNKGAATQLAADEKALNEKFEKQKGNLPLPVKGVIVTHFGVYDHPVLKGIKVTSNGVDISTSEGAPVGVVADGVVRKVFTTGAVTSVLVQHGLYYTVYTHLKNVSVQPGDGIRARQTIGTVTPSPDSERNILHFELWKQTNKQDPEKWFD